MTLPQTHSLVTSCFKSQRSERSPGSAELLIGLCRSYANEVFLPAGGTARNSKYIAKQSTSSKLNASEHLSLASTSGVAL